LFWCEPIDRFELARLVPAAFIDRALILVVAIRVVRARHRGRRRLAPKLLERARRGLSDDSSHEQRGEQRWEEPTAGWHGTLVMVGFVFRRACWLNRRRRSETTSFACFRHAGAIATDALIGLGARRTVGFLHDAGHPFTVMRRHAVGLYCTRRRAGIPAAVVGGAVRCAASHAHLHVVTCLVIGLCRASTRFGDANRARRILLTSPHTVTEPVVSAGRGHLIGTVIIRIGT
jgi:hypothetical protein